MKIGVIITTNDIEKCWNTFRYMNTAIEMNHTVTAFLMNSGVECEFMDHEFFNISMQIDNFIKTKVNFILVALVYNFVDLTISLRNLK